MHRRLLALPAIGLLAVLGQGLASVGYTVRALAGGARVLLARRPIERVLADPATPASLRERLELVQELTAWAGDELALPAKKAFRHYADLGRPYAVWTVVAAPELSVEPLTWCFPIAGCVSYRGYFSEEAARRFASQLREKGHDVSVGGVAAYSTLGWFADPVLDTFVASPPADLAGLLFHELAHRQAYAPGDTDFNESFATAVEREGVRRWLRTQGDAAALAAYERETERTDRLVELALATRDRLAELYATPVADDEKRAGKQRFFAELRAEVAAQRAAWGPNAPGAWLEADLDNADLASLGAYHRLVPAFERMLAEHGGELAAFYEAVRGLARAPREERLVRLEALRTSPSPTARGSGGRGRSSRSFAGAVSP